MGTYDTLGGTARHNPAFDAPDFFTTEEATSFAPTVVMPGGGTVTPEGWMWVLGFAMAGCEWAIEAAERDGLQQRAMDFRRRQRIYWQECEIRELEARLAQARKQLADLQAPNDGGVAHAPQR